MKNLQKAIEEILFQNNIRILHRNGWGKDSERHGDAIEFDVKALSTAVEELTQLITSREQEIADDLIKLIRYHQEYDNEFDEAMVNTEYFVGILEKYKQKETQ